MTERAAEVEVQVQFYDVDPMQVVWHGHYARFLEHARCALLGGIGYGYDEMKASGYSWPVIDLHIRYARPAVFGQRLRVRAELVEWENRMVIEYVISDAETGQRLTRASTDAGGGGSRDAGDPLRVARDPLREAGASRGMRGIALVALCAAALPLAAQGATPSDLERIQSMLTKPDVLCGHFEQTKTLVGVSRPVRSRGRFCVVTGKGILWSTTEPFVSSLLLTPAQIVESRGGQVTQRLSADKEPGVRIINEVLMSLLAGDLSKVTGTFDVAAQVTGSEWEATLTPRAAGLKSVLASIALGGGHTVTSVTLRETGGDRTVITFSQIATGTAAMQPDEAKQFE